MRRNYFIVAIVFLVFFVLSLLSNILGPIIPDIIDSFHVSLAAAAFLPFSFFLAYGVLSIPAGFLVDRFSEKPVMLGAFTLALAGALAFAFHPAYPVAVASLFIIGSGMALLQVAINPLLRVAGGEENFAFNSASAQFVFGAASFLSPQIYAWMIRSLPNAHEHGVVVQLIARVTPPALAWASIYWIFAAVGSHHGRHPRLSALPARPAQPGRAGRKRGRVSAHAPPPPGVGLLRLHVRLCRFRTGTVDWISKFLSQYHGFDPHTTGASAVSWFWGMMTVGCIFGMILFKAFDSRRVLIGFAIGALLALTAALFGPAGVSLYAFPAMGFFASIMWPNVISLALNSVSEHHGSFAGILCTGIVGGAVVPLIIGRLGDLAGLRTGMMFLYLTFGCVLSIGFWAKPLIANATFAARAER